MKRLCAALFALLLCLSLALPALAYPAGIDPTLPRVVDNNGLFSAEEIALLEQRIAQLAETYQTDLVILTVASIGSQSPEDYADDFFDYGGYGWRTRETQDITTGSGTILLLVNMKANSGRRSEISSKGSAEFAFGPTVVDSILDQLQPLLVEKNFLPAAELFLSRAAGALQHQAQGSEGSTYAEGYTQSEYAAPQHREGAVFSPQVFLVGLIIAFAIALAVVLAMRRGMNTARPQTHASDYMTPGSFRLTQHSDTFLYSKTTKVRIDTDSHGGGGGGGFSAGGGGRISSSGSHHSGGGRSF